MRLNLFLPRGLRSTSDHPTPLSVQIELRQRWPLAWLALLLAAALLLPDRTWNTLLVGLGGLFIVAYAWARWLAHGLRASRRLRFGWVSVGDRLEEWFELRNDSPVPALWVEIADGSTVPGYRAAVVRSVDARGQNRWRQSAVCQRRGQFTLGPWRIHTGDPFGIFRVTRHYPATNEIIIHPPIYVNLGIPLPAGASSGRTRAQRRAFQATVNAAAVRNYTPDDPLRWIHWPTSARQNALFVRQFDLETAGDVWLLLDMQASAQLGREADGTEEHAVLLAASLAARALRRNRAVGLAAYGRVPQVVPPGRGQGQQWKLLRALALLTADGDAGLSLALQDLNHIARRGTAAVIITPSHQPDWIPDLLLLAQRGVQVNVILLDRASFGGERGGEGLRDAIRKSGFTCHVVRQGELGQPLEEEERRGFWEFRVSPTGRVITVQSPLGDTVPG
ncbi:MAG: DUF58 domain-containing protein [Anaerolineae bacterium]